MTGDVRRRWTSRLPLRTQLVALLVSAVALVVLVTGLTATAALRGHLLDQVDRQLTETLRAPQAMPGGPSRPGAPGRRFALPGTYVAALYSSSGALLRQEGLPEDDPGGPELPALDAASAAEIGTQPFTVDGLSGDTRWRVLVLPLRDGTTRVSALPLEGVNAVVRRLVLVNVLVGLAALGAAGGLALWGVRRSLQPLVQVERTAETIAAGDLSVRVPESDRRTEVGSLAASFNSMVDRFEQAFTAQQRSEAEARASEQRMRRFVADASHELRTPLTSIRGFAELYRQGAVVDEQQLRQVMRRIEDEGTRMGALVEDLLLLARLDQQRPLARDPVDLTALAAEVTGDVQALTEDHEVRYEPPVSGRRTVVRGDEGRLRQVVGNLVRNAVVHTPPGTTVRVRVEEASEHGTDEVVLTVSDDGPGMPTDVADRVFERFFRADASRSREAGSAGSGSGLGLSIVAGIVAAHGGTCSVETAPGAGSAFRITLPVDPD